MSDDLTSTLCRFASETEWEDAPSPVRSTVTDMLRDCLGVALAGSVTEEMRLLRSVERPAVSASSTHAAAAAAMLLGVAAHALDYDDIHLAMGGHPSAVVVGAVAGAAAAVDAPPGDVLAGFLVGVETAARIGRAISAGHYHLGWHPTSVVGTLSAAFAASRVMRLDAGRMSRALGLAAAMASGTKANFGTFSKPLQVGNASRAGLVSATYAGAGLTANESILDDQHGGFTRLFTQSVDESAMVDGLGSTFSVTRPEPVIKLIPACGGVHAATWATVALAKEHDLDPDDVAEIAVEVHPKRIPHTNRPTVRTGLEGKFSTQYCVAVAATQRRVSLADFEDDATQEQRRQSVMKRTTLGPAADADEWPGGTEYATGARGARVTVRLKSGDTLRTFMGAAPGYPGNRASDDQLREKFMDCARRAVPGETAGRWYTDLAAGGEKARDALMQVTRRVVQAT